MSANKIPWSGWYWSMGASSPTLMDPNGPLEKFDQYIQKVEGINPGTKDWERANHYKPSLGWAGHCNGWSAAAILEDEPRLSVNRHQITFSHGDLKGLLSEAHFTDTKDLWKGWRDTVTWSKDDKLDAKDFHEVLLDWVGNGEPVVMDMTCRAAVWNYPVYDFVMTTQPDPTDANKTHITCTLKYASDGVGAEYLGTKEIQETFYYWITGDSNNPSGANWELGSENIHPGFIWHPDYVHFSTDTSFPSNPLVQYYSQLKDLLPKLIDVGSILKILVQSLAEILKIGPIPWNRPPDDLINPLLFRGLVALDARPGHAVPAMAASWSMGDNGLTYTFRLREGLTFHDGVQLTANDVVFTYRLMMDRNSHSPNYATLTSAIASVDAADEHTVIFKLHQPIPAFPAKHAWHWIFPRHLIAEQGFESFSRHPVGSGPFTFVARDEGHVLMLAAFSNYYLGSPELKRIEFFEVPDSERRLELVAEGRADLAVFPYTLEMERKSLKIPGARVFAAPDRAHGRLEVQSLRVDGRVANTFDGGWNAEAWRVESPVLKLDTPMPMEPLRRRFKRGDIGMTEKLPKIRFPQWRPGIWWQLELRQKMLESKTPDPGWSLPTRIVFEILSEETVETRPCYHLRVTYPDRPPDVEYKYADVWVSVDDRNPIKGLLHIGGKTIPLRHSVLIELLKPHAIEPKRSMPRTLLDPRLRTQRIELPALEMLSPTGGSRVVSLAVPFPLRIDEPDYIVELQDWGT